MNGNIVDLIKLSAKEVVEGYQKKNTLLRGREEQKKVQEDQVSPRVKADAILDQPNEQITTLEQAKAVLHEADVLYERGDFAGAMVLYDKLLEGGLVNPYIVRKARAIICCKAGQILFCKAEQELKQLLEVLNRYGPVSATSSTRYWYLVARNKGDEKKAMDEFLKSKSTVIG